MTHPANETGTRAVLRTLAGILERAAAIRAAGAHPRVAINRAAVIEGASPALACVARAAWALALLPDGPESTAPEGMPAPPPRMVEPTTAGEGQPAPHVAGGGTP
jgi:hypothetical protein